jgi:putative selenium metabolism hydrolase
MSETAMQIDEQGLIAFTRKIIRTPSLSMQEELVASLIADKMRHSGFDEVVVDPIFNIIGYMYGEDREAELLFNGHIDTVPPSNIPEPFSGRITDGKKYGREGDVIEGRGASDNKGAVASMIHAAKAVKESGVKFKKTFIMTAVTREEMANGEGILRVLEEEGVKASMALSGEATGLNVHLGHRGKLEFNVRTQGKTSHASNPALGINAIYKMCDLIQEMREHYILPTHPVLGECTFTLIDIISAPGRLGPITPDCCEIALDRRYLPEESAVSVQKEIEAFIEKRKRVDPDFKATVELEKDFPPLYCPEEEPIVAITRKARQAVMGDPGEVSVWKFGVDGTFIQRAGIPCAGFGPSNEIYAHTPDDHVPLDELVTSCKVYAEIIKQACC